MAQTTPTHGVVFVHGLGSQHESDFFLDVADPLLTWLARWSIARNEPPPALQRSALAFSPIDTNPPTARSHALLTFDQGDCWALTEAWWAADYRRQSYGAMLGWCSRHIGHVALALGRSFYQRWVGNEKDAASVTRFVRRLLAIYAAAVAGIYFVTALIGLPLVMLLLLLIKLPIPTVQSFLLGVLQPFIEINLGEFRAMLEDELQAANMRRVVAEMVLDLVSEGCATVTIIAHSGGAVVSFDMLTDPAYREAAAHVRKFITVGSGLNKAWSIVPHLPRLQRSLPDHIHWVDVWATFDPVPAGWMTPPKVAGQYACIFAPAPDIVAAQGLLPRTDPNPFAPPSASPVTPRYWPVSVKVTNALSVLADHGLYWRNDEEVMARFAAEIDAEYYRESRFWKGNTHPTYPDAARRAVAPYAAPAEKTIRTQVRRWRERVILLAFVRAFFIAVWAVWVALWVRVPAAWLQRHSDLFPIPNWLAAVASDLRIDTAVRYVAAALFLGFIVYLLFTQIVQAAWNRWNAAKQQAATAAIATAPDSGMRDGSPGAQQ